MIVTVLTLRQFVALRRLIHDTAPFR